MLSCFITKCHLKRDIFFLNITREYINKLIWSKLCLGCFYFALFFFVFLLCAILLTLLCLCGFCFESIVKVCLVFPRICFVLFCFVFCSFIVMWFFGVSWHMDCHLSCFWTMLLFRLNVCCVNILGSWWMVFVVWFWLSIRTFFIDSKIASKGYWLLCYSFHFHLISQLETNLI